MSSSAPAAPAGSPTIPITIITGFLGSGKTTLILNLIPQLPPSYRLALIKNEFGDVAVDSQLAGAGAIAGVRELLNGCICCNLVGSLRDALETLTAEQQPDRFVVETSGSAFPATLALEVNRLARETGRYHLDGVVSVIDVENWQGYEDVSYTAKVQAQYTDLLVLNKWEEVSERKLEDCVDRILDLELDVPTARTKSDKGKVDKELLLGLDAKLAALSEENVDGKHQDHDHDHDHSEHKHDSDHSSEVEVLSITLPRSGSAADGVNLEKLNLLLKTAPKDEVYRIKSILYALEPPTSSTGEKAAVPADGKARKYILNWAFGRWTFAAAPPTSSTDDSGASGDALLRMTVITARDESTRWSKKLQTEGFVEPVNNGAESQVQVQKIV